MSAWEPVIGLEIHIHLKTRTKMFCRCSVEYGDEPNTHTCPICLGHPGRAAGSERPGDRVDDQARATRSAAGSPTTRVSTARTTSIPTCRRATRSPSTTSRCASTGGCSCPGEDGDAEVGIVRAHLEEDAAKNVHVGGAGGRIHGAGATLVDFNRGGTPLVEIVTAPDLRSRRGRAALPAAAAPDGRRARHLRRGDGEGLAALRRQRVGAAGGLRRAADAHGAEEHELVRLRRARHRARGRAADRACTRRAARSTRRRSTSTRRTSRRRRCARRRRRRTTATSPSRTSCRSSRRPSSWSGCGRRCRSCRARGSAGFERDFGLPFYDAEVLNGSVAIAALRGGRRGRR